MASDPTESQRESAGVHGHDHDEGMDRRTFVRRAGVAGAALAAAAASASFPSAARAQKPEAKLLVPRNRIAIGLEAYAFSAQPPADPYAPLAEISDLGYRGVELIEFGGFGSLERAKEVRHLLSKEGLRGLGNFHLTYATEKNIRNSLDEFVAEDKRAGMDNFGMVAAEHTPEWQNEEGYKRQAEDFNTWAAITKKDGMRFYVHNEAWVHERDPDTGKPLFDVWVEETDPDLVFFAFDLFWPSYMGFDPVPIIDRIEDRILQFHIKDWSGTQAAPGQPASTTQTDPGEGVIDFARIVSSLENPHRYWYIVEREGSPDPSNTARTAYSYLASLTA